MTKNNITEDSYVFVEKPDSDRYSIRIEEGIYDGVIVTFGKVSLTEAPDKTSLKLSFTFTVNETAEPYSKKELDDSAEFKNYIGDVLNYILSSSLESGKFKIKSNGSDTRNDSAKTGKR